MTEIAAVFSIFGVALSVITAIVVLTFKITRSVAEVEYTVKHVAQRLEDHITSETRIGEQFRTDTTSSIDTLRRDLSNISMRVERALGRGGHARPA